MKSDIRKLISQRKRQLTEQELCELSLAVVSHLLDNEKIKAASTVLLYYSMPGEVYTHDLVEKMHVEGKTVLLPKMTGEGTMCLIPYTGRQCLVKAGTFNVLEPHGEPITDFDKIDVAVVPGIAFTADGRRMGRGKGYYDRFLSSAHSVYKIGLCFPFQLLEDIPTDAHDVAMDEVVC